MDLIGLLTQYIVGPLNQNSGAITAIFSVVVGFATVAYVWLTRKLVAETRRYAQLTEGLVSETKEMREAQTKPNVFVTALPDEENKFWIDMLIQNMGLGPAFNIKFELTPDFYMSENKQHLSEVNLIKNGLPELGPNQKWQFPLTRASTIQEKLPEPFEIEVTYEDSAQHTFEHTYSIDFSQFLGLWQLKTRSQYK
jgi:hypothetical protein